MCKARLGSPLFRVLRRPTFGAALAWGCTVLALGCDTSETPTCLTDTSRACSGDDGCHGSQTCAGDPPSWSTCACEAGPSPDDAGTQNPSSQKPRLGADCQKDSSCPRGAVCSTSLGSAFFGGRPVTGTCVADCSSDTAACKAFDKAVCVDTARPAGRVREDDAGVEADAGAAPSALCFEGCHVGGYAAGKCHEAPQIACEPLGTKGAGFCRPVCSTDAECEHGACDRRSGTCIDAPTRRDATFGIPCDHDNNHCDGLCIDVNEKQSLCTHRCVFGSPSSCVDPSAEARGGGCLVVTPGGGIGDIGYCMPLCECPGDCPDKSSVCDPFDDKTLKDTFGTAGVCTAPEIALHEPLECR